MTVTNLGDLSHSYAMRQRNVALRLQIDRFSKELATGQVAEIRDVLAGNYSYLTDIERRRAVLEGFGVATAEAAIFSGNVQRALGVIGDLGTDLSTSYLTAGTSAIGVSASDTVAEARNALDGLIGAMNTSAAGRYIFSGVATDQPPLPDSDTLLTALRAAVAGAATVDDLMMQAQAWFDDPAGFAATVYQGSDTALSPYHLSESDQVALDIRAVDPALRDVLRLTAIGALAEDAAFGFDIPAQSDLFDKAGQALLIAQDNLIALRADVGFAEARVDKIAARNAAELTSLEYARIDLLRIDPYEAATKLEEAQFQLQSLYSVTVRMSQLSLVNFL